MEETGTRYDDPDYGEDNEDVPLEDQRLIFVSKIGEGGKGKAFLFTNYKKNKYFVMKTPINQEGSEFLEEANNLMTFRTSESIKVYDIPEFFPGEARFFIMDYIPGASLHDFLECLNNNRKEFNIRMKYEIIFGISQQINLLHKKGAVHRDIKPSNIFVDQDFHPHLGDFGEIKTITKDVVTKNMHGSNHFFPPEASVFPIKCGPPYDVYEFGCTLFQIITFEWPFNDRDEDILENYTARRIRDERVENGDIELLEEDEPLYSIVKDCWKHEFERRPSMKEITEKIYDLAKEKLSNEDFEIFNKYACSIEKEVVKDKILGTKINVEKAIYAGFVDIEELCDYKPLHKIAKREGLIPEAFIEAIRSLSYPRKRPPTKTIRK